MPEANEAQALLEDLIARARRSGADAADAVLTSGISVSVSRRLGATERLERAEGHDLGLRVLVGRRQAIVSTSDIRRDGFEALVERAVGMARLAPEDPLLGLADPNQLTTSFPDLDTVDPIEPSAETLIARASLAEDAARAVEGVTNSEGADASWSRSSAMLVASNGFVGRNEVTRSGVSATALAGSGTGMERDYDYSAAVHASDLEDPALIGQRAGERAVRRLNPRKIETMRVPVIFDRRVAGRFLSTLAGSISGGAITRGTSFLKEHLGKPVFGRHVTIIDDPTRPRGLRSRPFDGEGLATTRRRIIDAGVLTTWLLDLRSARQLGLAPTGHASRGTASAPSPAPSNLFFEPGAVTVQEMIGDLPRGLLVTELMGAGVNGVTGDYSQGAAGYWIEGGEIAYPVSEITIAGHALAMFADMTPANDLIFKTGMDAPSLRVGELMVAGR